MDTFDKSAKMPWAPPKLQKIGEIAEILKAGGGKLSTVGGDPGDFRKPTGQN